MLTTRPDKPDPTMRLTDREHTALWLHACGNTYDQVAEVMGIQHSSVKEYMTRARRALGARNGAHAVHLAYQHGLFKTSKSRKDVS